MDTEIGFLVVEDEPQAAESIARLLERYRPTQTALTVREAKQRLATRSAWTGIIADLGLPDGSGLDVVRGARQRFPLLPVLVLTGAHDRDSINRAHELRAEFVVKPASEVDLIGFVRRAVAFERVPDERLAVMVDELARQCSFTAREVDIVAAALGNVSRRQLLDQFRVTDNTLKSQIRGLLRKTEHESLDTLVRSILREALGGAEVSAPILVPSWLEEDS
jgi:DNA-binding NarL/FixJ family response regulator